MNLGYIIWNLESKNNVTLIYGQVLTLSLDQIWFNCLFAISSASFIMPDEDCDIAVEIMNLSGESLSNIAH